MRTIKFYSFDRYTSGRVVTHDARDGLRFVLARNPYGSHNLVVVQGHEAIAHGNIASLSFAATCSQHVLRKVAACVASRTGMRYAG